ncbi:MAG TPA: hypothetical protein VJQ82_06010 [Terriglobales bacterium]|nr:hypothetical protein [Terriglobales bacterium]
MTALDRWLEQATRSLSWDSAAQVRAEIREHYEAARDRAIHEGSTADEADGLAVRDLGDAKAANCQYRKVLLTSAEARVLREGAWEAHAICSRPWLKWILAAASASALLVTTILFLRGSIAFRWVLLCAGVDVMMAAPFLPVYTPDRARAFRILKWAVMLGAIALVYGPNLLKWSWLLFSCLWTVGWVEWTRNSIRRKIPVAKWPKQLYL